MTGELDEGDRLWRIKGCRRIAYADRAKAIMSVLLATLIACAGARVTMANVG